MAVNAFHWKQYTDEEIARRGDPMAEIKRNAVISATVTEGIHKLRKKKPSHGTIFGITEKALSTKAPDMMETKSEKGKGSTRSKRAVKRH